MSKKYHPWPAKALLFGPLLILSLLITGCHSPKKPCQKIVRINFQTEPCTLDPRKTRHLADWTLMKMLFEGLTRVGPDDQAQLALAKEVKISEDLKTYTFHLQPSLWSNGDSVTAADFVYAWRKVLSPEFLADNAFQLYVLKNAKAIKLGELPPDALGVRALDSQTLVVELEHPTPYFLELIAMPIFSPIHQKTDKQDPLWAESGTPYVCNGPFYLKGWRHQDAVIVAKNPSYWDAEGVFIDEIEMAMVQELAELQMYEKGKLHWAGSPISKLTLDALNDLRKKHLVHRKTSLGTAFIRLNVTDPILQNRNMRKALGIAIDRKAITEHITQNTLFPAQRYVPPYFELSKAPYFSDGDIKGARALFTKGLEEIQVDASALPKLTLTYVTGERTHLIAQAIQEQWRRALGLRVQLEGVERKVFFSRIAHQDYQLSIGDWFADFNDPVTFLEVFKFKAQSTNNTGWENPEYAQLLEDSFSYQDREKRQAILAKSERLLLEEAPIIPLYHHSMLYLKHPDLENVLLSSLGYLDFKWARWKNDE